ncbi:MAG: hypothetical protein AAF403_08155, partial [Pseudomonadota bacterium]
MQTKLYRQIDQQIKRHGDLGFNFAFWIRDDDTSKTGPKLAHMLKICQGSRLLLAIIPEAVDKNLSTFVNQYDPPPEYMHQMNPSDRQQNMQIAVAQHGWNHQNHAPQNHKKMELGYQTPTALRLQLLKGATILKKIFTTRWAAGLVPPWNRIDLSIFDHWDNHPYQWISCFESQPLFNPLSKQPFDLTKTQNKTVKNN